MVKGRPICFGAPGRSAVCNRCGCREACFEKGAEAPVFMLPRDRYVEREGPTLGAKQIASGPLKWADAHEQPEPLEDAQNGRR